MKTKYCKILLLVLLLGFSIKSYCQTYITIDSIQYELNSDNTASVCLCDEKKSGDLSIPRLINYQNNGYLVTTITDGKGYRSGYLRESYYGAFYSCKRLTSVTIPNSVTSISSSAFSYCTGLTSVTIPNSVTSIGQEAFSHCTGLTSVTIPNSVTSIRAYTFSGCTGLTSVTIPNSVTSICQEAFSYCTGLTSVTIPNSVRSIDPKTFYNCTGLTSVTIGNGVTSIGSETFYNCKGLTSVTIPDGVTSIGPNTFNNCTGLTSVRIGNGVTSIGNNAFCFCTGLTSITIPNSVTSIDDGVFSYCTGLTSVTIDNAFIPQNTFSHCTGLTSITIGKGVKSIDGSNFNTCTSLKEFIVDLNNTAFAAVDGVLFNKSLNRLIAYVHGKSGRYTIPDNVTSINQYAFNNFTDLTSVTIPNSTTSIGLFVFSGCTNLSEVICMSSTPPTISNSTTFDYNMYNSGTLYVPIGSANNYATKTPWNYFNNIIEKDLTGIKLINNIQKIYTSDKSIIIENDNCSMNNINVYYHDGVLVKSVATDKKHTEIPVNNSGMYIVKTNSDIQKVIVK